jgi:ABC-2 type transport system ATP-binding protein
MSKQPVVELHHVSKTIDGEELITDLSFSIHRGEIYGLLGPNGSGKTLTIRMMVGLISMTSGDISIHGYSIRTDRIEALQHVGAIVENPDLYGYMTGMQNLKHFARMYDKPISKERIMEVIDLVELSDAIHRKVKTYSLGMRQRLGIAQALLHRPSVLILDEPTNGLDPAGIHQLRNYLYTLAH